MSSNFLPQALFMVPRTSDYCQPKNLAFSAAISRRPSAGGLVSRVSTRFYGHSLEERDKKISFSVRAEASAEAEVLVGGSVENAESVESEEAEASLDIKSPTQPRVKLGDIMGVRDDIMERCEEYKECPWQVMKHEILNRRAIEASDEQRPIPDLRVGDIVEIKLEVPENRRRLSIYKGIIMSKQNAGIHTTIRIRRIIAGVGVEIVFPVYSPNIKEIKEVSHRKVRRAKLYFLRDKLPRLSTFK